MTIAWDPSKSDNPPPITVPVRHPKSNTIENMDEMEVECHTFYSRTPDEIKEAEK